MALLMCSEWGDKSQVSAIALAPQYGYGPIVFGGAVGFVLCILCSVIAGKLIKECMHPAVLAIIGSLVFIGFGIAELI